MSNPISLNVICQALSWMSYPQPLSAHSSRAVLISPQGTLMNQVTLIFNRRAFHQAMKAQHQLEKHPRKCALIAALDCFCADITVMDVDYVPGTTTIMASMICTLAAKD